MRIVIVGGGEVGSYIAEQLTAEKKDVILIEKNKDLAKHLTLTLDCLVVTGDATHIGVLEEAHVESADIFIAATVADDTNMILCFLVNAEFDVPVKIARIHSKEYMSNSAFRKSVSGVDYLVNVETEAARSIYQAILHGANKFMRRLGNDVRLAGFKITESDDMAGMTVQQLNASIPEQKLIVTAILRDAGAGTEELIIPSGNTIIKLNDTIYLTALSGTFYHLSHKFHLNSNKLKSVLIVGGAVIGMMLAELLLAKDRRVVLMDKNYDTCAKIADKMPQLTVLHADITEQGILESEHLDTVDVIVTTTHNQEINIISGVYAKSLGVKRAIAVVESSNYITLASSLGIDTIISTKQAAAEAVMKYIRKGNVRTVYSIFDGQAEAVEVVLTPRSKMIGVPLKDLNLPSQCLLIAVKRENRDIIPDGYTVLKDGDSIIFFVSKENIEILDEMLKHDNES